MHLQQTWIPVMLLASVGGWSIACFAADNSLYHRLGGREMMRPMVNDFVDVVFRDSKLRLNSSTQKFLDRSDSGEIKGKLMEAVCEASGGPCKGASARASLHSGLVAMELAPSDWEELQRDLAASLSKFNVPDDEQSELKSLLSKLNVPNLR